MAERQELPRASCNPPAVNAAVPAMGEGISGKQKWCGLIELDEAAFVIESATRGMYDQPFIEI